MGRTMNGHWIDGSYRLTEREEPLPVVDPATEEVISEALRGNALDVDSAVRAAVAAFHEWRYSSAAERVSILAWDCNGIEEVPT